MAGGAARGRHRPLRPDGDAPKPRAIPPHDVPEEPRPDRAGPGPVRPDPARPAHDRPSRPHRRPGPRWRPGAPEDPARSVRPGQLPGPVGADHSASAGRPGARRDPGAGVRLRQRSQRHGRPLPRPGQLPSVDGWRLPGPHRRVRSLPAHQPGPRSRSPTARASRPVSRNGWWATASKATPRPPTSRSRPGRCPRAAARPPGCPKPARWHGDAGSSWVVAGYRSTLYNHALPPAHRSRAWRLTGRPRTWVLPAATSGA